MFQLFYYKPSRFAVMKLIHRESRVALAYEYTTVEHGSPNKTVTYSAKALTSNKFKNVGLKYFISTSSTVPYCQHQNFTGGEGRDFNFAVCKYLHNIAHTLIVYWCYYASFLGKVCKHLVKSALYNKFALEVKHGNTNNISIFCFLSFSLVWHYNPTTFFPREKMSPGFSLNIAENTGD